MAEIELKHVSKIYEGGAAAVRDFSLDIHDREFVIFVGPPGLETSMETCFTSRPPDKASSILLTEATVPSNCSPVSSNMIRAVLPTAI